MLVRSVCVFFCKIVMSARIWSDLEPSTHHSTVFEKFVKGWAPLKFPATDLESPGVADFSVRHTV